MTDDPFTLHDDDLPIAITHSRDTIAFGGVVEQDYRFLTYRFAASDGSEVDARVYFDDPWEVSILAPADGFTIDAPIMRYLQNRFDVIKQLGGPEGYTIVWQTPAKAQGA
jgi:hypothetical protein